MRCLAIRHAVWSFLELDYLLVRKTGTVVDDLHRVCRRAHRSWACCWLSDLATINIDFDGVITDCTTEEGYTVSDLTYVVFLGNLPSFISGMIGVVRITRPLTLTSLSISIPKISMC